MTTGLVIAALLSVAIVCATYLAIDLLAQRRRREVAEQRAIDDANAELLHDVAERSRELGDAVAQLAARRMELVDEKVVDDRYVIIGKLGTGTHATVYEVERIADGQRLAMKLLRGRADPRRTARFAREARGMAAPIHPNLVATLDVGIVDDSTFIVMPLVEGGSLLAHHARFGERAWAEWMLVQVATGLAELHARGVLHRDLRAANVLVSAGQAKLADAGLAELVSIPTDHLAPELQTGGPATRAADIYSFGHLAQQLFGAEPLPAPLARCLSADPTHRPPAADLAAALTTALTTDPAT